MKGRAVRAPLRGARAPSSSDYARVQLSSTAGTAWYAAFANVAPLREVDSPAVAMALWELFDHASITRGATRLVERAGADAAWGACFQLANELCALKRISRRRWIEACVEHFGLLGRVQAEALFESALLFGAAEDVAPDACAWETLALVIFVQMCGEPAAPSTAMEWPSSSAVSPRSAASPLRRRSDTVLSCIATASRRPTHRARWFGRHAGHFLELLHPRRLAALSACAMLRDGGSAATKIAERDDLCLSRAKVDRAVTLLCRGALATSRVPCADANGEFNAIDVALWLARCVSEADAVAAESATAVDASGASRRDATLTLCNASCRTLLLSSDLDAAAADVAAGGREDGESAPLRSALVSGCDSCFIYALMALRTVHIVGCTRCTIVIGAAAKTVTVEGCSELRLMCCTKQLRVISTASSALYLHSPPRGRPVLMGDNRELTFAPYNVVRYDALYRHLAQAGITLRAERPGDAAWGKPLELDVDAATARAAASLSAKRADAADCGADNSAADGAGGETATSGSGGQSACWRRLVPARFAEFVIPFSLGSGGGGAGTGAASTGGGTTGTAQRSVFAAEWTGDMAAAVERRARRVSQIRAKISAAGLSLEREAELVDAVEGQLWEWLMLNGHALELAQLARVSEDLPAAPAAVGAATG